MDVVFDQPLMPPEPTVRPTPRPPAATPTPRLPADPAELLRQGNAAWDRQDWVRAMELYEALLRQVPGHPIAAERGAAARTNVAAQQREAEAARRAAERARREAAERAQQERAQREAAERERRNVPLYRETARTYIDAGQWDKAVEWLRKIAAVDPSDDYLQSVLEKEIQMVERELAAGRLDAAEAGLQRLRGLLPEARSVSVAGKIAAAREAAEAAQTEALEAEGDRLLAAGDRVGAREAWVHARRLQPAHPGLPQRIESVRPQSGEHWVDSGIGMRFRYIPAGSFEMGSPSSEPERSPDERQHRVTLTRGYWMGETEVTQAQWRAVMGTNPSHFSSCGDNCPVEQVSWFDAVAFANAMSRKVGLPECYQIEENAVSFEGPNCTGYRLPTEAEWEYAARATTLSPFSFGVCPAPREAVHLGNFQVSGKPKGFIVKKTETLRRISTVPVRTFAANNWGLYEVHGNVSEWVWDWYGWYLSGAVSDPTGPSGGSNRVFRGGSWGSHARGCRSAFRDGIDPGYRISRLGLRLVRTAE